MIRPFTPEEFAEALHKLAKVYEEKEVPESIGTPTFYIWCHSKENLQNLVRFFGGKWKKHVQGAGTSNAEIVLESETFPVRLSIPQNKVCKQTVTYDCEPLFSPAEEAQIEELVK